MTSFWYWNIPQSLTFSYHRNNQNERQNLGRLTRLPTAAPSTATPSPSTSSYSSAFTADPTPSDFTEIKATHAALLTASYFVDAHCRAYSDDYMQCKRENGDPAKCALEGRKVTRCALDLLQQLENNCGKEYERAWRCLGDGNNYYWKCRGEERELNRCVFSKMVWCIKCIFARSAFVTLAVSSLMILLPLSLQGYKKVIPDAPDYEKPVHMREENERWYK